MSFAAELDRGLKGDAKLGVVSVAYRCCRSPGWVASKAQAAARAATGWHPLTCCGVARQVGLHLGLAGWCSHDGGRAALLAAHHARRHN